MFSPILSSVGNDEISLNTSGRVANRGMDGLAIMPDGKTLVGIMQNALIQDAALGGAAKNRIKKETAGVLKVKHHPENIETGKINLKGK